MNRRSFLHTLATGLAATAALAVVDPEELIWRPGAKTIFLPAAKAETAAETLSGLTIGDIFTIDGVWSVNPLTGRSIPFLQQFVVTSSVVGKDSALIEMVHPAVFLPKFTPKKSQIQPLHTSPIPGRKVEVEWSPTN